mgnify:CR=1 FL=1
MSKPEAQRPILQRHYTPILNGKQSRQAFHGPSTVGLTGLLTLKARVRYLFASAYSRVSFCAKKTLFCLLSLESFA